MPTTMHFCRTVDFTWRMATARYRVHRYDKDGNWKSLFGAPGKEDGQFNTPHGIWIDDRPGREAVSRRRRPRE